MGEREGEGRQNLRVCHYCGPLIPDPDPTLLKSKIFYRLSYFNPDEVTFSIWNNFLKSAIKELLVLRLFVRSYIKSFSHVKFNFEPKQIFTTVIIYL